MSKKQKLKRNTRVFEFNESAGDREVVRVYRNSYEGGPLFEGRVGISLEDFDALVKWVNEKRKR